MKKLILVLILAVSVSGSQAFAAKKKAHAEESTESSKTWSRPYGSAGCGWGSQIMGRNGGQISASTTNATGGQVFAITSGTSNCVDNPNDEVAQRMDRFIVVNVGEVAGDISRGNGETIVNIAHMMGCSNTEIVGSTLQRNFHEIFPTAKIAPNEVTDSIISVVKTNESLTAQCKNVI